MKNCTPYINYILWEVTKKCCIKIFIFLKLTQLQLWLYTEAEFLLLGNKIFIYITFYGAFLHY